MSGLNNKKCPGQVGEGVRGQVGPLELSTSGHFWLRAGDFLRQEGGVEIPHVLVCTGPSQCMPIIPM